MKVAGVFGLGRGRGHVDDGPDTGLTVVVANKHREELVGIGAVGLEASEASVDLDRGGVDDEVEPVGLRLKKAMDTEAVSARLEAGDDGHGVGQLEACASESDLAGKGGSPRSSGSRAGTRTLGTPDREHKDAETQPAVKQR